MDNDKRMFQAMKLILEKGSFSLTKREAAALVAVDQWLDKKINEPEKKRGNKSRT